MNGCRRQEPETLSFTHFLKRLNIAHPPILSMAEDVSRWCLPDLSQAIEWAKRRNRQGIRCVIDPLGELAKDDTASDAALYGSLRSILAISENGVRASVAIKPTALGGRYDPEGCLIRSDRIARFAWAHGLAIEVDMEARKYLQAIIDMALELRGRGEGSMTLALQAYMGRTPTDIKRLDAEGIKVRMVKGAYAGDISDHDEVRQALWRNIDLVRTMGRPFSIGTHDPMIIRRLERHGELQAIAEIGMLKGLGDETKLRLAERGWSVAEYVPYGEDSYDYVARRLNYLRKMSELGLEPVP